jgi:hypothetical protein
LLRLRKITPKLLVSPVASSRIAQNLLILIGTGWENPYRTHKAAGTAVFLGSPTILKSTSKSATADLDETDRSNAPFT